MILIKFAVIRIPGLCIETLVDTYLIPTESFDQYCFSLPPLIMTKLTETLLIPVTRMLLLCIIMRWGVMLDHKMMIKWQKVSTIDVYLGICYPVLPPDYSQHICGPIYMHS